MLLLQLFLHSFCLAVFTVVESAAVWRGEGGESYFRQNPSFQAKLRILSKNIHAILDLLLLEKVDFDLEW